MTGKGAARLERWRRDTRGKRGYDGVGRVWREKGAAGGESLGAALGEIPAASAGMTVWGGGMTVVGRVWREKGAAGVVRGLGTALGEIPAASAGMTVWGAGMTVVGAGVVRGLGAALGEIPAASAGMTVVGAGYDGDGGVR